MSEQETHPTLRSSLLNLPLLNRVKVVKELLLSKLDDLQNQLHTLDHTVNSLAENDVALLEAIIGLIQMFQQQQQTLQQQNQLLMGMMRQLTASVQQSEFGHEQKNQQLLTFLQDAQRQQERSIEKLGSSFQQQKDFDHQLLNDLWTRLETMFTDQQSIFLESLNQYQQETSAEVSNEIKSEIRDVHSHLKPIKVIATGSKGKEPELGLAAHLYSYLPSRYAMDIGANIGDFSESLLKAGYEVFAFEPFPPVFSQVSQRLSCYSQFHCYPFALGDSNETMDLYVADDQSADRTYGRGNLFNSLTKHSMPEDLVFTHSVPVIVRTLESLHNSLKIPTSIGLVKIDTEGYDLKVIRGMGDYRYPVVITEFWDSHIPFAQAGALNNLEFLVKEMRARNYSWFLVLYRIWGKDGISFYCNYPKSLEDSWGNIFFFQDQQIFAQALQWCSAILPVTHLY